MRTIQVSASKTYDVVISPGMLEQSGERIKTVCGGSLCALVTDDLVDQLYAKQVEASMLRSGYRVIRTIIKNGEQSKNAETYIALLNFLASNGVTRKDVLVALGGGVVGDLTGFAAATYMRGTALVQLPTTLLACVDSSVGGKTAIDLDSGKNLAGAFYQPDLVLCDTLTLNTLSPEIFRDGCAEVIKYGFIADNDLLYLLKEPILPRIEEIIARCVTIKRDIVCEDEQDLGLRQLLNFGHTFGHAIESLSGYTVSHGSAVAIGMAIMTRAAVSKGLCDKTVQSALEALLRQYGLPCNTAYDARSIAHTALSDKKRSDSSINLIVPVDLGKCEIMNYPVQELEAFIAQGLLQ